MTLYIFRYHRQWKIGIVGIIAESVADAIGMYSPEILSPTDVVKAKELPMIESGIVFDEEIENPEYEG